MKRDSKTQSGKLIQIGITCIKYCQMSDYNLRMVIPSPLRWCSNCWTATRALECSRAPGMRTTRHAIGRGHNVRVGLKPTSTIISNDDRTYAMAPNAGLVIGRQLFCFQVTVLVPSNLLIILFWFDSRAPFYSSEDLYAHQTRGTHVQCSRWYVSRL